MKSLNKTQNGTNNTITGGEVVLQPVEIAVQRAVEARFLDGITESDNHIIIEKLDCQEQGLVLYCIKSSCCHIVWRKNYGRCQL